MDPVHVLPIEQCQEIFLQLSLDDVNSAVQVSDSWYAAIACCDKIWRKFCDSHLSYCTLRVQRDREQGFSWREVFERNIDYQKTKRAWMSGHLSKPTSVDDLPTLPACTMDMDDWAQILEAELSR